MSEKTFYYQETMKFSYEKDEDVKVIRVIRTKLFQRGEGTEKDPRRKVEQYWSMTGELLWEDDPYKKSRQKKKQSLGIVGRK